MNTKIMRLIHLIAVLVLIFALFVVNCTSNNQSIQQSALKNSTGINNKIKIRYNNDYRFIESTSIPRNFENTFPNKGNPNSPRSQNIRVRLPLNPEINPLLVLGSARKVGKNYTETGVGSMNIQNLGRGGGPGLQKIGIAVDGVLIEPGTAEVWDESRKTRGQIFQVENAQWSYDGLGPNRTGDFVGMDKYKGHVQPTGLYHYHSITSKTTLYDEDPSTHSKIIAFAADGIPIFGPYGYDETGTKIIKMYGNYKLKDGERVAVEGQNPGGSYDGTFIQDYEFAKGEGDVDSLEAGLQTSILDEANGHVGKVPADEMELYKYSEEYLGKKNEEDNTYTLYHYHVTQNYPYSPRKLYGVVDKSFVLIDKPKADQQNMPNRPKGGDPQPKRPPPKQ